MSGVPAEQSQGARSANKEVQIMLPRETDSAVQSPDIPGRFSRGLGEWVC